MKSVSFTDLAMLSLIVVFGLFLHIPESEAATFANCQVFSSSGVYNLITDITTSGDCLVIDADNVTIDLGGHFIQGDGDDYNGIGVSGDASENVTITNGTISDFSYGIKLKAANSKLRKLIISDNYVGVSVGEGAVIAGNIFKMNRELALNTGNKSIVKNNNFMSNNRHAVIEAGSIVTYNNAKNGNEDSIEVGEDSLVAGNAVYDTFDEGLTVGKNSLVVYNQAYRNGDIYDLQVICPSLVIGNSAGIAVLTPEYFPVETGDCISVNNSFDILNP